MLEMQRSADRADHLQRAAPLLAEAGSLEQRDQLRRDEHRVGHPLPLDELDHAVGVESGHQHVRAAEVEGRHEGEEGAVEDERPGVEHDALGLDAEARREAGAVRLPDRVGVHDPLREPRRPRRVDDVEGVVAIDRGGSRRLGAGGVDELVILEVARCRAVDEHVAVGGNPGQIGSQAVELRHHRRVRDQDPRVRVVDEIRQPGAAQERGERHDDETRPRGRVIELDHLDAVLEHRRDLVALLEAEPGRARSRPGSPARRAARTSAARPRRRAPCVRAVARVAGEQRVERHQRPWAHAASPSARRSPPTCSRCLPRGARRRHRPRCGRRAPRGRAREGSRRRSCGPCRRGRRPGLRSSRARPSSASNIERFVCSGQTKSRSASVRPERSARRVRRRRSSAGTPGRARPSSPPGPGRRGTGSRRDRPSRRRRPSPGASTRRS